MSVHISIITGPIPPEPPPDHADHHDHAGACLTFEGIVRPTEAGQPISALLYTAYEPMASQQMHRIAADLLNSLSLLSIHVTHARGRVPVHHCSLRCTIRARHRAEALDAMARFIDLLKRDVPIWKQSVP